MIAGYELENRSLSYFLIDPRKLPPPAPPTDAQLQAFLKQNAAALKRPEMRNLTIVRFSTKALAPSMPVDQAAVLKLYNFRKDSLSQPEKRSLIEIPVKNAGAAQAIAAKRLKAGEWPRRGRQVARRATRSPIPRRPRRRSPTPRSPTPPSPCKPAR